jgi:hypothetical protein
LNHQDTKTPGKRIMNRQRETLGALVPWWLSRPLDV